ncbi:MAG: helix-turn-helix transcriptional regulator [Rubrivivax sp.]
MSLPPVDPRQQTGARLKEARKLAGLSQGRVAEMMGMHRPTVSEIEAGNRRVSTEELARFAHMYDVSIAWLAGSSEEQLGTLDPKIQLAARELSKLKPENLDRLLRILASMRQGDEEDGDS